MLDLKDKYAIVTGGGTGIGRSIALHLAKEGCNLILTGLGEDDLNQVKNECEALGVKPEEGVGLEDSFNGVRSCKASGLYTIMVPDIIQPDDEMKGLADMILPSLKDVQDFLNLK